jgi:diguanylate cyclase (GGDEF)-like protein
MRDDIAMNVGQPRLSKTVRTKPVAYAYDEADERTDPRGTLPQSDPPSPVAESAAAPGAGDDRGRLDTPLLPPAPASAGPSQATLTLLTGPDAGRIVVIDDAGLLIGRAETAGLVTEDPAISRQHARIGVGPNGSYYIEDLGSTNGTFVGGQRVEWAPLASGDTVRLGPELRLRFAITDETERSLQNELYESSVRDPLTHAYSRRYFNERLWREHARVQRTGGNAAVLLIDVDNLKKLNDELGHLAGDRALCAIAALIAGAIRPSDVLARYGGDEFMVLVPNGDHQLARALAGRIRAAVARRRFAAGGSSVPVTVSIGVASLAELQSSASSMTDLIALADVRLYQAKRSGRNGVGSGRQEAPSRPQGRAANAP